MRKIILTEQQFNSLLNKIGINESHMQELYHFTDYPGLAGIASKDVLLTDPMQRGTRNNQNYVSFTRHKSPMEGFANPNGSTVRITLDTYALQQHHPASNMSLKPFEFYSPKRNNLGTSAKQKHIDTRYDTAYSSWGDQEYYNQAEESLQTNDRYIPNISKYITRIDVCCDFSELGSDTAKIALMTESARALKQCCGTGCEDKICVYLSRKDYNYQTKRFTDIHHYLDCIKSVGFDDESEEEQKKREIEMAWSRYK